MKGILGPLSPLVLCGILAQGYTNKVVHLPLTPNRKRCTFCELAISPVFLLTPCNYCTNPAVLSCKLYFSLKVVLLVLIGHCSLVFSVLSIHLELTGISD